MDSLLTKNTILQVNATIIAGLLILFTIQSVTTDSLFDLAYNYQLLTAEDLVLRNLQGNVTEAKKMYENIDEEGNVVIQTNPTDDPSIASFTIPPPLNLLEKQELQISQLSDENFKERVKLQAKIDMINNLPWPLYIYSNPQFVVSLLILPFITSMLIELASWSRNVNNKIPNIFSFGFFVMGLIIMLVIFGLTLLVHIASS